MNELNEVSSLGSVIKSGLDTYFYQGLSLVFAILFVIVLFNNGTKTWQLEQVNKALKTRTSELIDEEAKTATLSGAIRSQNSAVKKQGEAYKLMEENGKKAKAEYDQHEVGYQKQIKLLRESKTATCDMDSISKKITTEVTRR